MKNPNHHWIHRIALILFAVLLGCENTFEPMQENDQYVFSMYGAVDLHGEFSKVRVMPVGESLIPADPEPNGTEVTLIRDSTGETIVLSDSLFRFGGRAYVWNYFTTERLHANEEYTILAEAPDGRQSRAAMTLPSVLPFPEVEYTAASEEGIITGSSNEPVVTMETRYMVQIITKFGCDPERELVFSHLDDIVTYPDGRYRLEVNNLSSISGALGPAVTDYRVNRRELVVISSGEDWPDTSELSEEEMVLPDIITNVENGTGLVAGIAGRKVEITPRREPC